LFEAKMKMLTKLVLFPICLATLTWAATNTNFSGNYAAQQKKGEKALTTSVIVVQTDSAVRVTRVYGSKSITNSFPLDGSEGDYTTETGVRGKCKAQLKGDTLVLESLVASPPKSDMPSIRFDTIEKWRLSTDTRILTIKTEIKSPDMPADVVAAAFPNNPSTDKYQRLDGR
jgi:hypothetical protein